jgi:hypothetical protein
MYELCVLACVHLQAQQVAGECGFKLHEAVFVVLSRVQSSLQRPFFFSFFLAVLGFEFKHSRGKHTSIMSPVLFVFIIFKYSFRFMPRLTSNFNHPDLHLQSN